MTLQVRLLALAFLYCSTTNVIAQQQGRLAFWSDSECNSKSGLPSNFGEADPIALNFTLSPDVCGVPGATVHSYRVLQKATCANGTTARFEYYNSDNCTADPTDEDPNPGLAKRLNNNNKRQAYSSILDGECLALIAFNSSAFICEGVAPRDFKTNSLSTSASSSTVPPASPRLLATSSYNNTAIAMTSSAANSSVATSSTKTSSVTSSFAVGSSATTSSPTSSSATISSPTSSSTTIPSTTSSVSSKSGLSAGISASLSLRFAIGVLAIAAL